MARSHVLPLFLLCIAITAGSAEARAVECFVNISHNAFFGSVQPGEIVTVEVWLTWTPGNQFAGLRGDTNATNKLGSISGEIFTPYLNPGWPSNLPFLRGTPLGGSIINTDIAVVPSYFTASPNSISLLWNHMTLIRYDWVAPAVTTPTQVNFDFTPYAIAPNARFYNNPASPNFVEADTTYLGTSLLVLPAPASAPLLLLALGVATRRRR